LKIPSKKLKKIYLSPWYMESALGSGKDYFFYRGISGHIFRFTGHFSLVSGHFPKPTRHFLAFLDKPSKFLDNFAFYGNKFTPFLGRIGPNEEVIFSAAGFLDIFLDLLDTFPWFLDIPPNLLDTFLAFLDKLSRFLDNLTFIGNHQTSRVS
jgi:hypothetical protein